MKRRRKQTLLNTRVTSIISVANAAGVTPLECPHCHNDIKMGKFIEALFKAVLKELRRGTSVYVARFGMWTPRLWVGRVMRTPVTERKYAGPKKYISWKQGHGVKWYLNERAMRAKRQNALAQGKADPDVAPSQD